MQLCNYGLSIIRKIKLVAREREVADKPTTLDFPQAATYTFRRKKFHRVNRVVVLLSVFIVKATKFLFT